MSTILKGGFQKLHGIFFWMNFHCASCGFNNPPGMRFCGNCGSRLEEHDDAPAVLSGSGSNPSDRLRVLMGSDLKDRFRQAGLMAAGQRRNVTVLFADLSDYTGLAEKIDSEDLYHLVQQFIQALAEVVYKYEGMVDKIIGDGLMALFGAPIAHENNAERAVRAALDMRMAVNSLSEELVSQLGVELKVHIGLNSGTVIVGGVGSDMLMDYTAIGDTVNLAHRIEEAAPAGTILVSENVYRQTHMLFDYKPVSALQLKGISRPVTAYRLQRQKSEPGSVRGVEGLRAPLVGRDGELHQLREAVQHLIHGKHGTFNLITGEAGIGKSRLTAELKDHIKHLPVNVIEGQSLTYRRAVSYWIFQDLMRSYLKVTFDTTLSKFHERLVAKTYELLGPSAADILPYLEHLLGLEHSDETTAARLAYLDASQLRQQIFLAVRELLVAESRQRPLVLILEDLHWADDASLDLLGYLVEPVRQNPIFIYAISRPFSEGKLQDIVERAKSNFGDHFNHIELQALSPEQSEHLFLQLMSIPEIPASLSAQVLQRSAGVPFYLEEILRMLIDSEIIRKEGRHWRLVPGADVATVGVPDTLRDLILARFDRLDPYHRNVLQAASVIGRQFKLPLLNSVILSSDEGQLSRVMNYLVARDFIQPLASSVETEYRFRHVLTSDAVYSTLLRRDRGALHGKVAEAIESLYADQIENQVEVLAGHYLRSSRLDRALHYLILSGQRAARDYANKQARHHYQEALNLLPQIDHTIEQAIDVLTGLGDICLFIGDYLLARDHYQDALDRIEVSGSGQYYSQESVLQRKIASTFERQGDYEQALLHLSKASALLDGKLESKSVQHARIANDMGWIHFLRGNFEGAQEYLSQALEVVKESSQYDVIASIHNRLGAISYHQSEYEKAVSHVRKSLVLRETIGDIAGVARLYNNLGLLGLMRGDLRDAEANFEQGISLLERIGDAEGIALAYTNLGLVQFDRGRLDLAGDNLNRSLQLADQIGHRFYRGRALMYLGRLNTAKRNYARSEKLLQDSISILEELGAQDNLIDAAYYRAENCIAQGKIECALEWIDKSFEFMPLEEGEESAVAVHRGRLLRLQGCAARLNSDWSAARSFLMESAAILNATYERMESAKTALELGYLARSQNSFLEARQYFQEAKLIFKQVGADLYLEKAEEGLHLI